MLVEIHDSSIQVGGCFTIHDRLQKNITGNMIMTIGKERMNMEMITAKPKTTCSRVPMADTWIKYFSKKEWTSTCSTIKACKTTRLIPRKGPLTKPRFYSLPFNRKTIAREDKCWKWKLWSIKTFSYFSILIGCIFSTWRFQSWSPTRTL